MMRYRQLFAVIAFFWSVFLYAEPTYTCWNDTPPRVEMAYPSNISFPTGAAGSQFNVTLTFWSGHPDILSSCQPGPNFVHLGYAKLDFATGLNVINGDEIVIDDFFSLKSLSSNVGGRMWKVPYSGLHGYADTMGDDITLSPGAGVIQKNIMDIMFGVSFTVVLNKNILGGGVLIPGTDLVQYYISGASTGAHTEANYASKPYFIAHIGSKFIPIPTVCNINNGQQINVDFGSIQSVDIGNSVLTSRVRMNKQIDISCSSPLSQDVFFELDGAPAPFSNDAIATSVNDIGVGLLYNNKPVPANSSFTFRLEDGKATVPLTFAVVKDPSLQPDQLTGGAFTASATLILASD
jgi:type 1 fimbria pilin